MIRLRVPGNVLLLGEYAVLETNGLGIAMAVEPFVEATVTEADSFSICGITGGRTVEWAPRSGGDPFLERAVLALTDELKRRSGLNPLDREFRITLDSSAFFFPNGDKRGFGSSAAVIAALVLVVQSALGLNDAADRSRNTMQTAVVVHRAAQSGRGSGYDVAASMNGGVGLFIGGFKPQWRHLAAGRMPAIQLLAGATSVDTRDAIERYQRFRQKYPDDFARFYEQSNTIVSGFADTAAHGEAAAKSSWPKLRELLRAARAVSTALGDRLDVPSTPSASMGRLAGKSGGIAKCLGAGDELVAIFTDCMRDAGSGGMEPEPVVPVYPEWS